MAVSSCCLKVPVQGVPAHLFLHLPSIAIVLTETLRSEADSGTVFSRCFMTRTIISSVIFSKNQLDPVSCCIQWQRINNQDHLLFSYFFRPLDFCPPVWFCHTWQSWATTSMVCFSWCKTFLPVILLVLNKILSWEILLRLKILGVYKLDPASTSEILSSLETWHPPSGCFFSNNIYILVCVL